jgi:hypothetical protein
MSGGGDIGWDIQASYDASKVADDPAVKIRQDEVPIRGMSHGVCDKGSVEADKLRKGPRIESLSIAESQPLALAPATASSLSVLGNDALATVNNSNRTVTKIVDKRLGPFGVEYKCEFESLWLPVDLVVKMEMGSVHAQGYERNLIRAGRLGTLRKRKRT